MKRENLIDDFYDRQPEKSFLTLLSEYCVPRIYFRKPKQGELAIKNCRLVQADFSGEEKLEEAFSDFNEFLKVNGIIGNNYDVELCKRPAFAFEEFKIVPEADGCRVYAGDSEGIRRALFRIEDILVSSGGNFPERVVHERNKIRRRISRCFFAPTNRPPKYGDELADDEDYYPDGYLRKLAYDGINAVWIPTSFDAMVKSSYITEFGKGSEKRTEKLKSIIKKCARFGIDVFLFVIEPISLNNANVERLHPDLIKKYPQANGNVYKDKLTGEEGIAFCTYTEFGKNYCIDAVEKLFTAAPDLAGLISITQGERITSCSTVYMDEEFKWHNTCPHCSKYSKAEILAQKLDVMKEGMRRVKPSAEFISWTYEHRFWDDDSIKEYVRKAPKDVVLMQNFEDNGRGEQLNRKRVLMDYWLSFPGYSEMFAVTAESACNEHKEIFAKMQICCSHELASVPYIPAPGIVYEKITAAKKLGVTGIMECWFFGNYPCVMSKAAEILCDGLSKLSKREFLIKLAGLYYSEIDVKRAVKAWISFERAYELYPWNVMFSYYGPAHDGVVWDLALIPKNFSLGRSWQLIDKTDGDRIGECLFAGHTIEEAIELFAQCRKLWKKGCRELLNIENENSNTKEQLSVALAIDCLIRSAKNILNFYKLRNDLGYERADNLTVLGKMRNIVYDEIHNTRKIIELCKADTRLGYHSEAEGYKFFEAKLEKRAENLRSLLSEEFTRVERDIKNGMRPLGYYRGEELDSEAYYVDKNPQWQYLSDSVSAFRIYDDDDNLYFEFKSRGKKDFLLCCEFELFFISTAVIIKSNADIVIHRDAISHQSINDERIDVELKKWRLNNLSKNDDSHVLAAITKKQAGFIGFPFKCMIKTTDKASWCFDKTPIYSLGKSVLSPGDFGWVIKKRKE